LVGVPLRLVIQKIPDEILHPEKWLHLILETVGKPSVPERLIENIVRIIVEI
jgi:hypothetical protein